MLASARRIPRLNPSPAILASIATLGDLFCHLLNHGLQATATIAVIAPMFWANGTEERCNALPEDLHDYYSGHVSNGSDGEKCHCVDAIIKNEEVVVILEEDGCIPLLEIIPADSGNLNGLAARIVKSTPEIPYVATSHVWVDGQ